MVKFIVLLVNLTLAICTSAAPVDLAKSPTCYSGLYILVARGSTASTDHSNKSGKFADLVVSKVPDSAWVKVDYPASLYVGNYDLSVAKGVMDTEAKIKAYVAACGEESRIALIGYSQGAHVMMNLLSGPAHFDRSYKKPKPLDDSYRKYIKAVVVFADPTFRAHQSFDAGDSKDSGIIARSDRSLEILKTYSKVLRSYCDTRDWFCAHGKSLANENGNPSRLKIMNDFFKDVKDNAKGLRIHKKTIKKHTNDAVDFIVRLSKQH